MLIRELRDRFPVVPVVHFVEAPIGRQSFRTYFTNEYGRPVAVRGSTFGWVDRNRVFYGEGPRGSILDIKLDLPAFVKLTKMGMLYAMI